MNNTKYIFETLNQLGIGRSSSRLYLEFLKMGPANVAQMARALNTSRQAIYLLLPDLLDRGLVKEVQHARRRLYQSLPPSQLFSLIDQLKSRLETVVPALTNIQAHPTEVPLVTIYDSPLSMREWYRHFLESATEGEEFFLYDSGNIDNWYKLDPEFYKNYMEQQVKRKIHLLTLLPQRKKTEEFIKEVGWSISEYRYTSQPFAKNVEQWIWRDEVCYQSIQGNSTNLIVLKSNELASFAKKQFMEIWNRAEN